MYIASSASSVKFHSLPEGNSVYNYQPGTRVDGFVRGISWSKDGCWLSVVPYSGPPEIISIKNQLKLIHTVVDVESSSCTAFQNLTRKYIAFGTKTGQVLLYDIKQKKIRTRYPRVPAMVCHIEFTAKDSHLVASVITGEVFVYSTLTNAVSCKMNMPPTDGISTISSLRTNPMKRNLVVGGSNEGLVVVWDTNVNKCTRITEQLQASVTGVAFSPINPDLIISTGSDRQFSCYDIRTNKCIANVPVKNSMTAIDFSHDGTQFALGSYEGNISLYDSRKILEPVLEFEAHKGAIQEVLFQKQDMVNSNSSLSEEPVLSERPSRNEMEANQNVSFANLLPNTPEAGDVVDCENASGNTNVVDSFMADLGLHGGGISRFDQSTNGDGDNLYDLNSYNRTNNENGNEEPLRMSLYKRRSLSLKQASTSTPTCPQIIATHLEAAMSPIVNPLPDRQNNNREPQVSLENLEKMVEEVIEKKLTEKFNSLTHDIKSQFLSTNSQMRRMHLDAMMANMKDFIKMEDLMKALRQDLASNAPLSENYLMSENTRLKKQIAVLKEQLTKAELDE